MRKNLSAVKKNQVAVRNRLRNKIYKSSIKTLTKKYINNVNMIDSGNVLHSLGDIYKKIDKAVKRGVLHKNKAARKKSKLAKMFTTQAN